MVPTDVKVALIDALTDAGFPAIEATSFVSPKWVPQMADAAEVMARIRRKPGVRYPVLTPNMKGFDAALAAQGRRGRRVRRRDRDVLAQEHQLQHRREPRARAADLRRGGGARRSRARLHLVRARLPLRRRRRSAHSVARSPRALFALGAYEVSLGDTIGVGTAGKTAALFALVAERVPVAALAGHFHDTYGQALTNVYAAMEMGVATFDCSVAGLGGCPYAKGATGNVASEDVVYLLNGLGIETGVDLTKLRTAGQAISDFLGGPPVSRVARALAAKSRAGMSRCAAGAPRRTAASTCRRPASACA